MIFKTKEIYTKSNLLSIFRLLLAVPFWFLLDNFNDDNIRMITFGLCLFASLTDILDGYLARKFNEVTEFGKIIDPLADKVAVGVIVLKLYLIGEISDFYFWIIILRDVLIFAGGIFITKKIGRVLPSNALGKLTVITIGIVILMVLLAVDRNNWVYLLFYYSSTVLIFISFFGYVLRASEFINSGKR
ncbi:MAG: CDP-alcohol phosphatidyltransferase family protein [Ignavibacteriales bacterium]|nr:MAG: CDP-alcohol phosphatidyltransferase family protein [Ignavibacteriales bacterium]